MAFLFRVALPFRDFCGSLRDFRIFFFSCFHKECDWGFGKECLESVGHLSLLLKVRRVRTDS